MSLFVPPCCKSYFLESMSTDMKTKQKDVAGQCQEKAKLLLACKCFENLLGVFEEEEKLKKVLPDNDKY